MFKIVAAIVVALCISSCASEPKEGKMAFNVECDRATGRLTQFVIAADGPGAWNIPIEELQKKCQELSEAGRT